MLCVAPLHNNRSQNGLPKLQGTLAGTRIWIEDARSVCINIDVSNFQVTSLYTPRRTSSPSKQNDVVEVGSVHCASSPRPQEQKPCRALLGC